MNAKVLQKSLVGLIRRASSDLPADVEHAICRAARGETNRLAKYALKVICKNIELARQTSQPLCQDTGTPLFYVRLPVNLDPRAFRRVADRAVAEATRKGYLRQNCVDTVTGAQSKNNLGPGMPVYHLETWDRKTVEVRLILKGGGSENVSTQYSLPDENIGAGRDIDGVRKCLLDAVVRAQGLGCPPGVLGVAIGGDRSSGFAASKRQLLRPLDDKNPIPLLARLERRALKEANSLGIGPMGLGGKATLLGVKVGHLNRVPASYFVSVSYMCWAFRRRGFVTDSKGKIIRWLY